MSRIPTRRAGPALAVLGLLTLSTTAYPQQAPASATPIGRTSAKEVQVSGAVDLHNGEMLLGNGSAITAGAQTVNIALSRGGSLRLCSTTAVHLSHDRTIDAPDSTSLMMALDRGAIETDYETGKYSDVLLTPDLRILISGPGHAQVSIRVNARGDTCIDNHGANAPYITVTSQFDGGLYRLHPEQHVTFERGSLRDVVDTEKEPCGCPAAPVYVASTGTPSSTPAPPGKHLGGPSSTPADTTFPLAESEGLAPPPAPSSTPVAAPGEVHAQVTVPLTFNGDAPPPLPPGQPTPPPASSSAPSSAPSSTPSSNGPTHPQPAPTPSQPAPAAKPSAVIRPPASQPPSTVIAAPPAATPASPSSPGKGFFHRVGHFFSRVFGGS